MARGGSEAPRERISVTYRPAVGDAKEEVELPLRIMVMGDFTLRPDEGALEGRELIPIDKGNFSAAMERLGPKLDITVPDTLSGDADKEIPVSLKFDSLDALSPDRIVENVPEFKELLEMRRALAALKGPMRDERGFRRRLQQALSNEALREAVLRELNLDKE